jgi:endonuclease/exonuclease/phosphatase family metal-dependent hydrolase
VGSTTLRLLTWNIHGLEEKRIGPRMEKLCLEVLVGGDLRAAIEGHPTPPVPDVLVFQEMTRRAHTGQIGPHFRAAGFTLWPERPPAGEEDYLMVAVRPPWSIESCALRAFEYSPLGRQCLVARLAHQGGGHLDLFTAHMESLRSGHEARLVQAREIDGWMHEGEDAEALRASTIAAVFAGDTNLRTREWEMLAPTFRSRDAFEVAGRPEHARATWSPGGSSPRAYRFDRVWLAQPAATSKARHWSPVEFRTRHAKNASDHAGVEVLLREIPAGTP